MIDLATLIWMTHPTATADAINAYDDGEELDEAVAELVTSLYIDDTFNEYSDEQLQAAATELIAEC